MAGTSLEQHVWTLSQDLSTRSVPQSTEDFSALITAYAVSYAQSHVHPLCLQKIFPEYQAHSVCEPITDESALQRNIQRDRTLEDPINSFFLSDF